MGHYFLYRQYVCILLSVYVQEVQSTFEKGLTYEIRFLLGLLSKTGTIITDKDKKKLEDDIEKATDNAQKTARSEQIREASNISLINRVRPNTKSVPESVRMKAKMVRASSLFDSNNGDKQSVNEYLEDNNFQTQAYLEM